MPTIDRKPPELPSLIAVAAALAREGRGAEAQAVKNAADLLARSACDGDGERPSADDLPPGPWKRDLENDVYGPDGMVIAITPGCIGKNKDKARAVANLLIWAERQVRGNDAARKGVRG
jgi:hypothetical protein